MLRKTLLLLPILVVHSAFAAGPEIKDGFFKTSDGVRLHYLEAGSGPGIVFEPGWTMPAWIWEAQIREFSGHYHVIALDPRSQGDSDKSVGDNSTERRAQDIHELVEHLNAGPVVLVGWSLGVPELVTYAERYGGSQVRAYVLVDGLVWDKRNPQFVEGAFGMYKQVQNNRREFTTAFVRSMFKKPQTDQYLDSLVKASLKMPTDSAIAASVSSISRADYSPAITRLDRPVLVMCEAALKSMTVDPIASAVPNARVEMFEDAGHALFVDDAERFNKVLAEFIQHLQAN